jgi:hypothetical protein
MAQTTTISKEITEAIGGGSSKTCFFLVILLAVFALMWGFK